MISFSKHLLMGAASIGALAGSAHAQVGEATSPKAGDAPARQAAAVAPAVTDQADTADIIVTAQKRAESIQSVPISVTVISSDQLARQGFQTIQDLSKASASLEFTSPGASPGGGGFVRGIGTQSLGAATAASSVGVVLDGVVLGNVNTTDIFDTARIEVLKGPQGTLFGSSVSAGVLNITTNAPRPGETSANVNAEFSVKPLGSEYTRRVLRAAVNLPISDNSALRVAAHAYNNVGLSHNTFTGADSDLSSYGVRVRYLANFTDNLTFNLIGDYSDTRDADGPGLVYRSAPAGSRLAQALAACGVVASMDNVDNCSSAVRLERRQVGGISGQFDWSLGETTLTSITSYRKSENAGRHDVIGIPADIARAAFSSCNFIECNPVVSLTTGNARQNQVTKRSLFTQEVRLASAANKHLEWVAGLYYQKATSNIIQPTLLIVHPTRLGLDRDIPLTNSTSIIETGAEDYAAFGNITYYLTPRTRLIAGVRYTHSKVSEDKIDPTNTGTAVNSLSTTDNQFTWRAGVQHDFSANTMVYATASTGYKAPQINDDLQGGKRLTAIRAERPTSFELGIKQSLFERRLAVNANVFYTEVKDFQSQSCIPDPNIGLACSNVNVPKVVTKGAELDVFGRPFQGTTINLSAIYNIAKYPAGFAGADGTDLTGRQLSYAPKYKVTLSVEQEVPLSDRYSLVIGGDTTVRGKQAMYLSSNPRFIVGAQSVFNARVGVKSSDNWSLFLFARNIGDTVYPTQLFPTQAFHPGGLWHVIDPNSRRLVGFQFQADF